MKNTESMLREALELLDGMSVTGRENRRRMAMAEDRLVILLNAAQMVESGKKDAKEAKYDENENQQGC